MKENQEVSSLVFSGDRVQKPVILSEWEWKYGPWRKLKLSLNWIMKRVRGTKFDSANPEFDAIMRRMQIVRTKNMFIGSLRKFYQANKIVTKVNPILILTNGTFPLH